MRLDVEKTHWEIVVVVALAKVGDVFEYGFSLKNT